MTFLSNTVSPGTFVPEKSQNTTLVLLDTWATVETHSMFFNFIRNMGGKNHTLEFKLISLFKKWIVQKIGSGKSMITTKTFPTQNQTAISTGMSGMSNIIIDKNSKLTEYIKYDSALGREQNIQRKPWLLEVGLAIDWLVEREEIADEARRDEPGSEPLQLTHANESKVLGMQLL